MPVSPTGKSRVSGKSRPRPAGRIINTETRASYEPRRLGPAPARLRVESPIWRSRRFRPPLRFDCGQGSAPDRATGRPKPIATGVLQMSPVPAGRVAGCRIAGKLSGTEREWMRAGRPRSRVGPPPITLAPQGGARRLAGPQPVPMRPSRQAWWPFGDHSFFV